MLRTNLSSVFYLCQLAMPRLIKTQDNIVNLSPSAGLVGQAYTTVYCTTKAVVINLSKSLTVEFSGQSVRVNVLCHSSVKTPLQSKIEFSENVDHGLLGKMFSMLNAAEPTEIATAIACLTSDKARFITGAALHIDGGQIAG